MEKNKHLFALVDCNNFYASCKRVFNPKLENKPVVILSNNDGCAVAMSNEAKKLGIKIGTPIYQVMHLIRKYDVRVFSSNYALYGDLSNRVMNVISDIAPDMEIYSIDEAFLKLDGIRDNLTEFGKKIKETVKKFTGIPVSVGIASTKTLAKLANRIAKKNKEGVLDFTSLADTDEILKNIDAEDIWGIGAQKSLKLYQYGIRNAYQLKNTPDVWVRKNLGGIVGLRTVWELRGISCIPIETVRAVNKEIISSRSFGKYVTDFQGLSEAVSSYITIAAEELRRQKALTSSIYVFIRTNRFKENDPQYHNSAHLKLPQPTSYTPDLINYALLLLQSIYRDGFRYKKAGIVLSDIVSESAATGELFEDNQISSQKASLMQTVDKINRKIGNDTVKIASSGIYQQWSMRRELLSPRYTTKWDELLTVNI